MNIILREIFTIIYDYYNNDNILFKTYL
jgi:hypothetical protein